MKTNKELNREDKEEFRKTEEEFREFKSKKALLGLAKDESNVHNWKKIK